MTQLSPQQTVERALSAARCDACVVIVDERTGVNLRWARNTFTTNGVSRARQVTVIAISGTAAAARVGVVSRGGPREDQLPGIVAAAEAAAAQSPPAEDARPLLGPGDDGAYRDDADGWMAREWERPPASTGIGTLAGLATGLGEAFGAARAAGRTLYGYANHAMTSTYLGTSSGLRLRHDQPEGKVHLNGKSAGLTASSWVGQATRDFTDVDLPALTADLSRRLDWAGRRVDLPAGRYETLLPPSAVADLLVYLHWAAGVKDALDGRNVFSKAGGGTRIGERIASLPVTLRGDPGAAGFGCAPFVIAHASGRQSSVFDNGLAVHPAAWLDAGKLMALPQTRRTAELSGLPLTPPVGNLLFEGAPTDQASLDQMIAGTGRGLLLTCLWYIRPVDPRTMLLTGLTRDGVYLVENGEVTGAVNNFRFNESPVGMLGRLAEVGASVPALPREWSEDFTRAVMAPVRVEGFNMSSVSPAN